MRIGFVGLGTMGRAMAANLVRAGVELTVWNRTAGAATELEALGARIAPDPAGVGRSSEIVVVCVSDTPDVADVLFGSGGLAEGLPPGGLVVDCSTISPSASRDYAARLARSGIAFLDAPVSGGSEGARNATLAIFVGGAEVDLTRARPVLEAMGRTVTHAGPVGAGQATKAVNQVILAGAYLGVAEGIVLAMRLGLDPDRTVEALGNGAAASWVLANRSGRMIANDYPLGFRLGLHRKDLRIALDAAREAGAVLPIAALCEQLEVGLIERGHGDEDMSALARTIRELAGLDA
jgi:3-hydroxyisobutyrate dehydrogenase